MKPRTIFRLLLLTATLISAGAQAQIKNKQLLDVYKVDFGHYIGSAETSTPMYAEMEQKDKAFQKPLTVYAHPKYLYAEDSGEKNNKTTWQVNYPAKKLMQL